MGYVSERLALSGPVPDGKRSTSCLSQWPGFEKCTVWLGAHVHIGRDMPHAGQYGIVRAGGRCNSPWCFRFAFHPVYPVDQFVIPP